MGLWGKTEVGQVGIPSNQEEVVAADTRMGEWLWKCTQAAAAAQAWPGDLMPQLDWGTPTK